MSSQVDRIIEQWHAEKPGLDVSPIAVIGRLSRTSLAVENRLAAAYATVGVDGATYDVLATLLRSGAPYQLTPAVLSRDSMISSSAVAQRLNKLEARGLVLRCENPSDGRGTLVQLTQEGKALLEAALPVHLENERSILSLLSPQEQTILAALLQKVEVSASVPYDQR